MRYTVYTDYKKELTFLLEQYPSINPIVQEITQQKGRALLTGGAVRDLLLRLPVQDIDIEVHDISFEQLEKILKKFGPVSYVGKSFGVLRIHGIDIDWSMPRKDSAGRKPLVTIDPHLSITEAFRRRDLTINAMGINLNNYELIDPFNGLADLQAGILRTPDPKLFVEDSLRFYRVMQFVGRFEMIPDAQLNLLCATMDISAVSKERIEREFEKLCLKSERPSLGIDWLVTVNRIQEVLPELAATIGVPQEPSWHPEGDVFEHSKQAFDSAAQDIYKTDEQKLIITLAALCHDLGKAVTTVCINGKWHSYNHEQAGVPLVRSLLNRVTTKQKIIDTVALLVRYHMIPFHFIKQNAGLSAYKRLARKLAPLTNILLLAKLARADRLGRNPKKGAPLQGPVPLIDQFLQRAQKAGVLITPEPPILLGRDLLDIIPAGPLLGKALCYAYKIQISENMHDKTKLKKRVVEFLERVKSGRKG